MKKVLDITVEFTGITVIHQKIQGYEVGRHRHSEHEFFLPLQGEISVDSVKAGPGRMLYVPPDHDHDFTSSAAGSGERVICLIGPKLWQKQIREKFTTSSFPANSLAKELLFYILIHREAPGMPHFVTALVETLGESLHAAQLERGRISSDHFAGRVTDPRIARAIELMEKDSLSLSDVAKQSGLSGRNFSRLFLKETGVGPKDFVILRRVEKAKKLLKESKLTVTDIALEVGYNSLSKFIATFKRIEGVLPSDYRATIGFGS